MSKSRIRTTNFWQDVPNNESEEDFISRVDAIATAYGVDRIIGLSFTSASDGRIVRLKAFLTVT